jgi:hypothetical protein
LNDERQAFIFYVAQYTLGILYLVPKNTLCPYFGTEA